MPNHRSKRSPADTDKPNAPLRKKPLTKTILDPAGAEGRTVATVFKPLEEKVRIGFFYTTDQNSDSRD